MSLIDVDLNLMRQFLMMNEQIEELKWQRKMHTYKSHNASSKMSSLSTTSSRPYMSTVSSIASSNPQVLSSEYLDLKYPSPSELSVYNADCYSTTETLGPSSLDVRLQDVQEENTSDLGSDSDMLDRTMTGEEGSLDRTFTMRSEPDLLDTVIPSVEHDTLDTLIPLNQSGSYCELDKRFSQNSCVFHTNTLKSQMDFHESVDLDTVIPPSQVDSELDINNPSSHKYHEIPQPSPGQLRKFESTILWSHEQRGDITPSLAKRPMLPSAPSSQRDFDSDLERTQPNKSSYAMKCSTLSSTGSNESTSTTESNSTDSGISDHDTTVEFITHF